MLASACACYLKNSTTKKQTISEPKLTLVIRLVIGKAIQGGTDGESWCQINLRFSGPFCYAPIEEKSQTLKIIRTLEKTLPNVFI